MTQKTADSSGKLTTISVQNFQDATTFGQRLQAMGVKVHNQANGLSFDVPAWQAQALIQSMVNGLSSQDSVSPAGTAGYSANTQDTEPISGTTYAGYQGAPDSDWQTDHPGGYNSGTSSSKQSKHQQH